MARYGLPYQGSKNKIADKIIALLPSADYFVDLFAGGCAMTHAAIESGKYKHCIANDISSVPDIFKDACEGKYADWTLLPTREEFCMLKDVDEAVALMFSFGNNKRNYLYGKNIEKVKHICEKMINSPSTRERFVWFKAFIRYLLDEGEVGNNAQLQRLQSLESLQSLQSLERLQNLERLIISRLSYNEVKIPDNSVVYCDPPYRNTSHDGYDIDTFNHEAFDAWIAKANFPVFISEYTQPKGTKKIANFSKKKLMCATDNRQDAPEALYINERFYDEYMQKLGHLFVLEEV